MHYTQTHTQCYVHTPAHIVYTHSTTHAHYKQLITTLWHTTLITKLWHSETQPLCFSFWSCMLWTAQSKTHTHLSLIPPCLSQQCVVPPEVTLALVRWHGVAGHTGSPQPPTYQLWDRDIGQRYGDRRQGYNTQTGHFRAGIDGGEGMRKGGNHFHTCLGHSGVPGLGVVELVAWLVVRRSALTIYKYPLLLCVR